jgi:hypothetical protein
MAAPLKHSLSEWIAHIFDHPVKEKKQWYFDQDAPTWEDTPDNIVTYIAETFEQAGELPAKFSDAQLDQGFWYLVSGCGSDFMYSLVDEDVPQSLRFRALHSFLAIFETLMAKRCSPHLSHLDEPGANPLNSSCYMWWDILPVRGLPDDPKRKEFDSEVLKVLQQILQIPHDACRESALHGLSHWGIYYPDIVGIIDDFLSRTPNLRPELIEYAKRVKIRRIQTRA